jgi:hypothetical protein
VQGHHENKRAAIAILFLAKYGKVHIRPCGGIPALPGQKVGCAPRAKCLKPLAQYTELNLRVHIELFGPATKLRREEVKKLRRS